MKAEQNREARAVALTAAECEALSAIGVEIVAATPMSDHNAVVSMGLLASLALRAPTPPSVEARADVRVEAGIYIASKTTHGARWRDLRASGAPIVSTWIDEAEQGATSNWHDLWHRCVREASEAAATIVYREDGEVLKGAWVEVGAALSAGKVVFAVGCDEFSIRHHMRVVSCASLDEALELAAEHLAALESAPAEPGREASPNIERHLISIADASVRADGRDIPLGETCRAAAAEIERLRGLLGRCRTVLGNMARENDGAIFNRWPINHEPLRHDAKNLLPLINEVIGHEE